MFYANLTAQDEEKTRNAGLEKLRIKVYEKMMSYNHARAWSKTENSLYL